MALTRQEFLENVSVATKDGLTWALSLGEDAKPVIDTGSDITDEDLVLTALAARAGVVKAHHPDREVYEFTLAEPRVADETLALAIDALTAAHRALARHLGIELQG